MKFGSFLTSGIAVAFVTLSASPLTFAAEFTVSSPTLMDRGTLPKLHVFNGFGCSGENRSPELNWANVPEGTLSFAITVFDPDAPTDSGWWHWIALNIPRNKNGLRLGVGGDTDQLPEGSVQIRSDFGSPSYGGACPPEGSIPHRYIFTVYALKVKSIDIPSNASAALASFMIKSNAIAKSSITTFYGR